MSHPILYDAGASSFNNLGLGVLKDATSCIVTEERNGRFQLNMTYPTGGIHAEKLKNDYLIKADAGHRTDSKGQVFRIERVDKGINGVLRVYAKHVSYLARSLALRPSVRINNATGVQALELWRDNIVGSHPFRVSSNIGGRGSTHLTIQNCPNARQALGGASGSILDVWGGEYLFDNYHVRLLSARGGNANTLISYGRNMVDLDQEENIANTFTSIYPYAIYGSGDDAQIITLASPNFVMDSENARYFAHRRVLPVDFSREFERDERPTVARLRELGEAYLEEHEIGVPRVSISLSFVDLTKALNGNGLTYEALNLCDTVPVYFEKLGIRTRAKVVRVEWNVLLDQYENIEVGHSKKSLGDTIRGIERDVNQVVNDSNSALTAANGRNTVFFGPNEPVANREGDLWYRPNGEHTELWTWNGSGWEFVMSTVPDEALLEKIAEARREAERALQEAEDAMTEARDVREIAQEAFDKAEPLVGITNELTGQMTTVTALAQGLQTSVSDLGANTQSQITQLSNQIHTQVSDLRNETQTAITQTQNSINLTAVNSQGAAHPQRSMIHIDPNGVVIQGEHIRLTGRTQIDHAIITDAHIRNLSADKITVGTLNASNVRIINMNADNITTGALRGRNIIGCHITGGDIDGSLFTTRAPNGAYSMRIQQGEIEILDELGLLSGQLRQNGLRLFSNRGEENLMGTIGRIHQRNNPGNPTAVVLSSRTGYRASITSVNTSGLHTSNLSVEGGGAGRTTDIWRLHLRSSMELNGNNINTTNTRIGNSDAGFLINSAGTISLRHRGRTQSLDGEDFNHSAGNVSIGRVMDRWGYRTFSANSGGTQTQVIDFAVNFTQRPNVLAQVVADSGSGSAGPSVTVFNVTSGGFSIRLHRHGFTGAVNVHWQAKGRRVL